MLISIFAFSANVSFSKVYPGAESNYTLKSTSISWKTNLDGLFFTFTSASASDETFSGNNVAGQLTYVSGNISYTVNGVVSRMVGNEKDYSALYFVETTKLGGDTETGKAWLLIVRGYESSFVDDSSEKTSSAIISEGLNRLISNDIIPPATPEVNDITGSYDKPIITGLAKVADDELLTVAINGQIYTSGDGYLTLKDADWSLILPTPYNVLTQNYSLNLNGKTDWVTIPNSENISFPNVFTLEAWVKAGAQQTAKIIQKGDWDGFSLGQDLYHGWMTSVCNSSMAATNLTWGMEQPVLNRWYHLAATFDGITLNLYVDGKLVNTDTMKEPMHVNGRAISIGSDNGKQKFFNGCLDNVSMWTVALSESDILQTKNSGITGLEKGLVSCWKFNEGSGTIVYNSTSACYSGNLIGSYSTDNGYSADSDNDGVYDNYNDFYSIIATVTDFAGNKSSGVPSKPCIGKFEFQTYNIVASPTFTTANISWSNGSRASRIVFVKDGAEIAPISEREADSNGYPANGKTYSASSDWTKKGSQLGSSGYYCVYKGTESGVKVTGLYPGRQYTVQAFEYSGTKGSEDYLTSLKGRNNPSSVTPWPSTTFTNSQGVTSAEAWSTSGRWDHDTIPSASLHSAVQVYIDGNCEITNNAVCQNLTINAVHGLITPKLTIDASIQLNVIGTLANNGGTSAILVKASTTLPNGTLTWGSGNPVGSVEMYSKAYINLSNPAGSKYNWQFFGIPVKTFQYKDFVSDPSCNSEIIREWDESITDYSKIWVQRNNGSSLYIQPTDIMTQNKGYELTHCSPKIHTFRGELLDTDFNKSLSYSPSAAFPGQNFYGNPFTAGIDISKITFGANTEHAVYLFNTGTYNDWLTTGGQSSPGNGPGQYTVSTPGTAGHNGVQRDIPTMQGFLVKATGAGGTIAISKPTGLMQNTSRQRAKGMASSSSELASTRIDLIGDHFSDCLWIFSEPTCTRSFDNGWDGKKFLGDSKVSQLYSIENDDIYQINAVNDMNESVIGFQPGIDTNFKMVFNHENTSSVYQGIYLVDLFANKTVDITESGSEYSFTASPTDITNRFKIITQPTGLAQPSDKKSSELRLYNTEEGIYMENLSYNTATVTLYNIAGKIMQVVSLNENSTKTIKTKQLIPGIYIARSETEKEKVIQRLIIK